MAHRIANDILKLVCTHPITSANNLKMLSKWVARYILYKVVVYTCVYDKNLSTFIHVLILHLYGSTHTHPYGWVGTDCKVCSGYIDPSIGLLISASSLSLLQERLNCRLTSQVSIKRARATYFDFSRIVWLPQAGYFWQMPFKRSKVGSSSPGGISVIVFLLLVALFGVNVEGQCSCPNNGCSQSASTG